MGRWQPVWFLALSLISLGASARDWSEYTSDHFTVYSDADAEEMTGLIKDFELFRLVTLSVLGLPDGDEDERLLIVAFDRGRDYARLRPSTDIAGYFYHSIYGPRMIVGSGSEAETRPILFHEYVHYLMHRLSSFNYPRWYSEGLASLLESAEISDKGIRVGLPPTGYARAIELGFDTTVSDVIDLKEGDSEYGFYVTSWLLTHYLLLDSSAEASRKQQAADYLRRFDAGEDPIEAFEASFGETPSGMNSELQRFGRRPTLSGLTWPAIEYTGKLARRDLGADEYLYLLLNLAVERDEFESADYYFDEFQKLDGRSPLRDKVYARRAISLAHQIRTEEGDEIIDRLIKSDIDDKDVLADIAQYALDRYVIESNRSESPDEVYLNQAIEYGKRAVEDNSAELEGLYYLGLSYEAAGELQKAADTLLLGYDRNPSVPRLNHVLARVLIKGGQTELASFLISRVYSASHSEQDRARYLEIMQALDEDAPDLDEVASML